MAIQAMAMPPTRMDMDGLSILAATRRLSGTTMIGRTITLAKDITRRLAAVIGAALAAVDTWQASAADTWEASAADTAAVATAVAERRC